MKKSLPLWGKQSTPKYPSTPETANLRLNGCFAGYLGHFGALPQGVCG